MILLVSGSTVSLRKAIEKHRNHLGILVAPGQGNAIEAVVETKLPWAIDNGAFSGFDELAFRGLIERCKGQPRLLWVACPDVVADCNATLDKFNEWQPWLQQQGMPVAFVGQDGQEESKVPWERMTCLFIGGTTQWKLSKESADLGKVAKAKGKWLHMGRVNSLKRILIAYDRGCDSLDGTSMSMFGDTYIGRNANWVKHLEKQPLLELC